MADSTVTAPSFLTVVLDLNPVAWSESSSTSSLSSLLPIILVFLNSHLALSHSNGLAFYACSTGGRGRLIYSTASKHSRADDDHPRQRGHHGDAGADADADDDASTYQHFGQLDKAVVRGVKQMIAEMSSDRMDEDEEPSANGISAADVEDDEEEETAIVKVLSMALNHLNRIILSAGSNAVAEAGGTSSSSSANSSNPLPPARSTAVSGSLDPSSGGSGISSGSNSRILILSSTPSASNQYIGLMNCIFAAQRRDIPIDVLKLQGEDTVFLQQAANLTGGIYFRLTPSPSRTADESTPPDVPGQLLQLLLSTFLPTPALRRSSLHLPALDEVDFRASCFCHGEIVDVGYVCGVCLSIFCHPPTQCHICSSPFPRRTLKRLQADLTAPRGAAASASA